MYEIEYDTRLREALNKFFKRDRKRYEICMKKIAEIANNPEHYKPLRYDMKNMREVHFEAVRRLQKLETHINCN